MPVIGLPKVLEMTISNILDESSVSSWNIKGSDDGMQVWIRFKAQDTANPLDNTNINYRKVPTSQQKRNSDRAKGWQNTCMHNTEKDFPENTDVGELSQSNQDCALNQIPSMEANTDVDQDSNTPSNPIQPSPLSSQLNTSYDAQQTSPINSTDDQHNISHVEEAATPKSKQYSTSSRQQRSRRSLKYKSVNVEMKCLKCHRDYVTNPPSQSYFCTRCPAFVCVHCVYDNHHMYHKNTLKGPASLRRIFERYDSWY